MLVTTAALAAINPAGQWAGDGVTLELKEAGGAYEGVLTVQGTAYPASGRVQADQFQGQFQVQGTNFDFTLIGQGNGLRLDSGGRTYSLERVGAPAPVNPLAQPAAPGTTPPPPGPVSSASIPDLGQPRVNPKREWTILLYLDGDNNLEGAALGDVNELEAVAGDESVEVIVLLDRAEGFTDADGDWTGTKLLRITPGQDPNRIESEVILDLGEMDMSDPETLRQAVARVLPAWPARQYAVVLWDHGGGWVLHSTDDGSGPDAHMSLPETRVALEMGLAEAGLEKVDLIGFDMCLMGQLEVGLELKDLADVLVFSEALEPGDGWPYDAILPKFSAGTMGARRLGQEIVQAYRDFYAERGSNGATQSAVDLQHAQAVSNALDTLVVALGPSMEQHWPKVARTIHFSQRYGSLSEIDDGHQATASHDLMNIMQRLRMSMGDGFPAENEYRGLVNAMDQFVLASSVSSPEPGSHGVAIYAPLRPDMLHPAYVETRLGQTRWLGHLQALHAVQGRNDQEPVVANIRLEDLDNNQRETVEMFAGHGIHFDVQGTNILQGELWDLIPMEDGRMKIASKTLFNPIAFANERDRWAVQDAEQAELLTVSFADGLNEIRVPYTGLSLDVLSGEYAYSVTIDAVDTLMDHTYSVPIVFEHPDYGRYGGTVIFDDVFWGVERVILEVIQSDGREVLTPINPPADATVTWLNECFNPADGSTSYIAVGESQWGDGPTLVADADEAGERAVVVQVETIGGAKGAMVAPYTVTRSPVVDQLMAMNKELLSPQNMVGRWEMIDIQAFMSSQDARPLGMHLDVVPLQEGSPILGMTLSGRNQTTGQEINTETFGHFDTTLAPVLRWWSKQGDGISHLEVWVPTIAQSRDGQPVLLLQNPSNELIWGYVKTGGSAITPSTGTGPGTAPGTPPAATGNAMQTLQGTWVTGDGLAAIQIENNQYGMYVADGFGGWEAVDAGQFTIQDNTLVITDFEGVVTQAAFQVDGQTLGIDDGTGAVWFQRSQ